MSNQLEKIKELIERRAVARIGGGEKAIAKQHEKGKYTARERLAMLLDEGSFEEMDMFVEHRCTNFGMEKKHYPGDGVVSRKVSTLWQVMQKSSNATSLLQVLFRRFPVSSVLVPVVLFILRL